MRGKFNDAFEKLEDDAHPRTNSGFDCDNCGELFINLHSYSSSLRIHRSSAEEMEDQCDECRVKFIDSSNLKRHLE